MRKRKEEKELMKSTGNDLMEVDKIIMDVIDRENVFNRIGTRALSSEDGYLEKFHIFDKEKLEIIAKDMEEINRATRALGRKNTQTTNKLMTLTMLSGTSPFRTIHQCLSQIERKRGAIKENRYKIKKENLKLEKLMSEVQLIKGDLEIGKILNEREKLNKIYELKEKEIEIEETASGIADSYLYIEGAFKDIASFQSAYKQICKNKNIPENWDEEDFEKAEIEHHLRMAFTNGYRDIMMTGRLNMGTLEYLHQMGVHPQVAEKILRGYLVKRGEEIDAMKFPTIEDFEIFLDHVTEEFKDSYKHMLKRIGLDSVYETWCMYLEDEEE